MSHAAKEDYRGCAFFQFLRDEMITPRQRVAFVPCMAPFIMDFGDLNRYVLRDTSSNDRRRHVPGGVTRPEDPDAQ